MRKTRLFIFSVVAISLLVGCTQTTQQVETWDLVKNKITQLDFGCVKSGINPSLNVGPGKFSDYYETKVMNLSPNACLDSCKKIVVDYGQGGHCLGLIS